MEAIADFSKKNQSSNVSLVRVVVYEADMVSSYLKQMDIATKPGSSMMDMVKGSFKMMGSAIKGITGNILQNYVVFFTACTVNYRKR